jgi:uncharacterized protein (DUF2235 family)
MDKQEERLDKPFFDWIESLNNRIKELESQIQELTAQLNSAKSEAWDAAVDRRYWESCSDFTRKLLPEPPDKASYIEQVKNKQP